MVAVYSGLLKTIAERQHRRSDRDPSAPLVRSCARGRECEYETGRPGDAECLHVREHESKELAGMLRGAPE
jgi:hypothetical protein